MKNKKKKFVKSLLPQTLLGRSLLILITPILMMQIITTYVFFDRHWSKVTSRLAYAVAGEVSLLVSHVENEKYNQDEMMLLFDQYEQKLGMLVTFDEGKGQNLGESRSGTIPGWEQMIKKTLSNELDSVLVLPYTVNVAFEEKWVEIRVQMSEGILNVSLPQRRLFSSTTYIFLLWMLVVSIVLLVIAILFMRNQIRPIRRLAISAEHFGKGRDVKNFKIEGSKEVRQAGAAFLEMKNRIQRQVSQRTEMLAGVSHDLRTPITRLKLQVAMLGDGPDIYEMKRDIDHMQNMIDGYLNFVRGEGKESTALTDICDILRDVTNLTKRNGTEVFLDLNDNTSLKMFIRPTAFKRCLSNLLNNASKYADSVWVSASKEKEDEVRITIEDNGPGIDDDKLEDVFRPFYRVDSSRNVETGGVGLGLPIVMDIIHSHGGEIKLSRSEKHGGLKAEISLPI